MLLKVFFAVLWLTVLQSLQVADSLSDRIYVVIIHKASGKVVASDGTLWDFGNGENWKQWTIFIKGEPTYYILKTALSYRPLGTPKPANEFHRATLVMGTSDISCSASKVDKVGYVRDNESQIWKINSGVKPIFNKCSANNQLIVKQDGNWTRLFTTSPSNVKVGDPNSLFEVLSTDDYRKSMTG